MMQRVVILLGLLLSSSVRAQDAQCSRRLTKLSSHINSVCCTAGVDCSGGAPDSCTRDCAALWMPFYRTCSSFATENLGALDGFSHMCLETAYGGPDGRECDQAYLTLGLNDVALACHCATPDCGLMDGVGETLTSCSAGCLAQLETVFDRCEDLVSQNPRSAATWERMIGECEDATATDAGGEAGSSCEEQCESLFSDTGEADVCACVYGCHEREAGQDSDTCIDICDNECDDDDECLCECGAAGTCSDCSSDDECESPCDVGCSLTTESTTGFSGLTFGSSEALDTAEEDVATGAMYMTSSDLELMNDGNDEQVVAVRFGSVDIPAGSKIYWASVLFVIDEVKAEADLPITIAIFAEASDNAAALSETDFDLSSRTPTESSRIWQPPRSTDATSGDYDLCWELNHCAATPWSVVGAEVDSPNIAHILQEVVDRPGWVAGNSIAVMFAQVSGTGVRTVESRDIALEYEYDVSPAPEEIETSACGAAGDGLHGPPSCETAHEGTGCDACPFGAEGDPDLMPEGWYYGAAQRCIVPDGDFFVGGTRLCYCHGHVAVEGGVLNVDMQSCEEFGTEWFRNHDSGHYADVDFEFLVRPAGCTPDEAGTAGYVCAHDKHDTVLLAGTEDSAEQDAIEGSMYLASTDLELMHDETTAEACPTCPGGGADAGSEQVVALRFNNVQIPRGAAISEAHVGFEIDEVNEPQSSDPVVIAIWGEYSGDASPPTDAAFDLSSRPPTDMSVTWSPPSSTDADFVSTWGTVGGLVATPSIVKILEEITSHPAWRPGNSLMILFGHISGLGTRWMVSHEDNAALHGGPFLSFSFTEHTGYASILATEGTEAGSVAAIRNAVATSNSVEETLDDGGAMYLDSSDLELCHDNNYPGLQLVGLRFPDLQIPEDAIITEPTHIVFQLDSEAAGEEAFEAAREPLTVVIYAEDTDEAAQFTANPNDLSDRQAAQASVMWQPGTVNEDGCEPAPRCGDHSPQCVLRGNPRSCRPQCWATPGCTVSTPDLSSLVQEVLTPQPDGHAITFVIAHISGNGVRWLDSDNRNARPDSPWTPMLVYSFAKPASLLDLPNEVRPVEETLTVGSTANTAEENVVDGSMYLDSSDLELMSDGNEQVVAVRFENVNIPQAAVLDSAYVTFQVDEVRDASADSVVVAIYAEDADNAAPISGEAFDLSSRVPTTASVIWTPATTEQEEPCSFDLSELDDDIDEDTLVSEWCPVSCGQGGRADDPEGEMEERGWGSCEEIIEFIATDYLDNPWSQVGRQVSTPDLAAVVETVVNRPGWVPGNALTILFGHVSGDGVRWVEAYFGDTPSLTYDILLTPNIDWTPGPGTTSATLVQASQMCGECDDEGCTGTYYLTDLKQATVVLPRFNPRKLRGQLTAHLIKKIAGKTRLIDLPPEHTFPLRVPGFAWTGFKGLDKGSLAACAHATATDPECGTYFHCDRTNPPCEQGCDCALAPAFGGNDCASRTAHPEGDDVGIDIYHLDSAEIVDPNRCDEETWPDLDTSHTSGVCGECKVLVDHFNSAYQSSCVVYCASIGRACVGAWEERGDTCAVLRDEACESPAENWGGTSDALCECGEAGSAAGGGHR